MAQDDDGTQTQATARSALPPVQTEADLPRTADEGAMCFVRERNASFVFHDGQWTTRDARKPTE